MKLDMVSESLHNGPREELVLPTPTDTHHPVLDSSPLSLRDKPAFGEQMERFLIELVTNDKTREMHPDLARWNAK